MKVVRISFEDGDIVVVSESAVESGSNEEFEERVPLATFIRDALLSIPEEERKFVISNPASGEHKVYGIRRNAEGNPEYDYNDVPES